MGKIQYSPASIQDLEQIGDYIAETLKNPVAALSTVDKIQKKIEKLEKSPRLGAPLTFQIEKDTDYRFLVCGNYLAFYRIQGNNVYIDRILYGKRDYIAILFGNIALTQDKNQEKEDKK